MTTTTVARRVVLWTPPEQPPPIPSVSLKQKEQECLALLKKCKNIKDLKKSHGLIVKWGLFWSSFSASSLLTSAALSEWGSMELACSIFNQIEEPGTFDFNTMIKGYAKAFNYCEAMYLYCHMVESTVQPDKFTYPILLRLCADERSSTEGEQLHGHIVKLGLMEDAFVVNSLINMYGKSKEIELSCSIFGRMERKDVASWSSIMSAHVNSKMWEDGIFLLRQMLRESDCRPEESVLVSALACCTHTGDVGTGRCIHAALVRNIDELNVIVTTSLVDMYAKCGSIEKALALFEGISRKNKLSYSAIISGLAMHGKAKEALVIFHEMEEEGIEPDEAIYVGVLSACSHSGLLEEGVEFFNKIPNLTINHYGCLVDLLARAGRLKEALRLILKMGIEANDVIWRTLLSGCSVHEDVKTAQYAFQMLSEMGSDNQGDHLLLSNMYAKAQRWEAVEKMRKETGQGNATCEVRVHGKIHRFTAQDKTHPEWRHIYETIRQMEWQLKFEGYSPDLSDVLVNVNDEEKKELIKAHGQKLALAYALYSTSDGVIRISRNFRMCGDCHVYTKMISFIYNREIVVRDRNRFHHFKDGACSCKDYW